MKAVKENKEYTITEQEKARYLADGYDICSDEGKLLAKSPLATVPYEQYAKVKAELDELKAANAKKPSGKNA